MSDVGDEKKGVVPCAMYGKVVEKEGGNFQVEINALRKKFYRPLLATPGWIKCIDPRLSQNIESIRA